MSYVGVVAARGRSGRTGLAEYTTKAALSIGGRTLLQHQLDFFERSRVERVVAIVRPEHVHLLSSQLSDEERRRVAFVISDADCESGWAGTLLCAERFVGSGDEVLLVSCDNLHAGEARRLPASLSALFTYTRWDRRDASPTQGPIFARAGEHAWEERSGTGYLGDFFSGYAVVRGHALFDALDRLVPSPRGEREFTALLRVLHGGGYCAAVPYGGAYEDVADLAALARYHARARGSALWQEEPTLGAGVVLHDGGRVLMTERADGLGWVFPGGLVDAGETFAQAAVREVREEVGFRLAENDLRLLGVYPTLGKRGEPACSILFHVEISGRNYHASPTVNAEVKSTKWVVREGVEKLTIPFDMVGAARDYFARRELDVRSLWRF